MASQEEVYKVLDKIGTARYKPSELAKAMTYIDDNYPAEMDKIIEVLVQVRCKIADAIMHRKMAETEADSRQVTIDFKK